MSLEPKNWGPVDVVVMILVVMVTTSVGFTIFRVGLAGTELSADAGERIKVIITSIIAIITMYVGSKLNNTPPK